MELPSSSSMTGCRSEQTDAMMLQKQETCKAIIFLVGHWPPLGEETRGSETSVVQEGDGQDAYTVNSHLSLSYHYC